MPIVSWLVETLIRTEYRWTPLEILATERAYPGLMTNLGLMMWQRRLLQDQLDGEKRVNADGE